MAWFKPQWSAPASVGALQSTRTQGASTAPFASFNLGEHVGDDPSAVAQNRQLLNQQLPNPAFYVNQVHGTEILNLTASTAHNVLYDADGIFTSMTEQPIAIMTADCLPVLLASDDGEEIAALHCGWRSLAGGIIEKALPLFSAPSAHIHAWLGPAIGKQAFEVGSEVKNQFCALSAEHNDAFCAQPNDKYMADLALIAKQKLAHLGVAHVTHSEHCTYLQADAYFSYRRDGQTGRMASVIWRDTDAKQYINPSSK